MRNIDELRQYFTYDPITGNFYWTAQARNGANAVRRVAGAKAGSLSANGYVTLALDGEYLNAHRLAWAFMTGEWPEHQIDHIDNNRSNNAWANLRRATPSENCGNRKGWGKSGFKGVYEDRGKFRAAITKDGVKYKLGTYATAEEAHAVWLTKANELYGEFAQGQSKTA